ncbi:GNAT family N-acetyltransferase [Pedococcus sp. NPDC057267]|uniref:GNAT family N-acetyltransferase n=1 Tax=Pedococcus sp. NPDC057267 TaxID=3346077 RepID=UPI00363BBE81
MLAPSKPSDPRPSSPLLVRRATADDRPVLERLWLLFRHDTSGFTGGLPRPDGSFRSERLESALTDPGWAASTAWLGEAPVGFAFVRSLDGPARVLNSFFVVAGARRAGVGSTLAHEVLRSFPGPWEVAFQQANVAAVRFWRSVAATHDPGPVEELRAVPGSPDTPPDSWLSFRVQAPPQ